MLGLKLDLTTTLTSSLDPAHLSHQGNHSEGQGDVLCGAVPHQLTLAVGRDEADRMLRFTLAQLDTLVELTIIDGNGRLALGLLCRLALAVHHYLVIDAKLA